MPFELPEDLAALSAADLDALLAAARQEASEITDALSDPEIAELADLDRLEVLAGYVETITAAQAVLAAAAVERAERATALAARINPVAEVDPEEDEAAEDGGDGEASEEAVAEVIAEAEAATEAAPEPVVAAVVHNVTNLPKPSAKAVAARAAKPVIPSKPGVAIVAAGGVPGMRAGQEVDLLDLVKPAMSRWGQYPQTWAKGAEFRIQDELFSLRAPARDPRLVANGHNDQDVMAYAADQSRLAPRPDAKPNQTGLIAAGGWCAPAEQRYEICTLAELDGILDVPTISMPRGSISYFRQLDYSVVAAAIAAGEFCFTNAQLVVDPPLVKPCFEIPCATPVEATLDVCGLCLRAGLLQQKAFPELIAAWMRLALIAHAHFLNARNLSQMVAGSTPLAVAASFGAISAFLDAVYLQAANYRFDNGMSMNATLEVVAPWWLPLLFDVDQERRQFDSDDDNDWRTDLAEHNIRVQWVKDLDDSDWSPAGAPAAWPSDVSFLMYAPGAWVRGAEDVISVSTLVDSTLLQTNRVQLLFIEAATIMLPYCGPSIYVTVPLCPNGTTGGPLPGTGSNACPIA